MKYQKLLPDVAHFDTEFNRVTHPRVNPVCISILRNKESKNFWTHNNAFGVKKAREYFNSLPKSTVLFGWQCVAEARYLRSIGVDPLKFTWIDGFLEYRCLTNHNDALAYGEQLVDGKVKMTKRPPNKYERTEDDGKDSFKPTHSLAEGTFKLLGKIRDTEHKNAMRDLIISDPESFTVEEVTAISAYCAEDVQDLPLLLERLLEEYENLEVDVDKELLEEMFLRGKYSVLTAIMEDIGYPVDVDKMRNFTDSVGPILEKCQKEINSFFPDIKPFYFNLKEKRFSMNQGNIRDWLVKNVETSKWMKTKKYKELQRKRATVEELGNPKYLSLSLDAFEEKFPYRHDYPEDNFGAQMVRYLKLKQSMNGFLPTKKGSIWDRLGPDGRIRCYLNPYGSQSSRSQPPSTSFLFLKPAWTRSLCSPLPGRVIGSFDYKSEEFLISALLSQSEAMIDSYRSGDVYLAFGKLVGMIPPNGTKQSHKAERDLCKALILGMSYLMSAKGLAEKLTADTGRVYTVEQAEEYINDFYNTYWELRQFQEWVRKVYEMERSLRLACGWRMFGDNTNFRSVANLPVQGLGASIMRKAVEIAVEEYGLEVIFTLHDAIYIEFDHGDWSAMDKLADAMKRGFVHYFEEEMKEDAAIIGLDGKMWGPSFPEEEGEITTPKGLKIDTSQIFVDERAVSEYEKFSRYFNYRAEVEL